jgi:hypothetical protein
MQGLIDEINAHTWKYTTNETKTMQGLRDSEIKMSLGRDATKNYTCFDSDTRGFMSSSCCQRASLANFGQISAKITGNTREVG